MDTSAKKNNINELKEIVQLIDGAIENDEYEEAFFLFIKFVGTLSNEDRDVIFEFYKRRFKIQNG
jgi:hypothetical protein